MMKTTIAAILISVAAAGLLACVRHYSVEPTPYACEGLNDFGCPESRYDEGNRQ